MGTVLAGALLAVGYPAAAAPAASGQASVTSIPASTSAAASYDSYCFTYKGTFKSGSTVIGVDWTANGSVDECFGIAPNRTIWHAWPGSGGWKVMPNNGLADDTEFGFLSSGHHVIEVYVASGSWHYYCSTLTTSWQPWARC